MNLSAGDDLSGHSDAVVKELRAILSKEKLHPATRKTKLKSRKSSVLAAMLVHSLRSDLRGLAGLEAPEEPVFEKPKTSVRLVPAVKFIPPMPEPEGPEGPEPFGFEGEMEKHIETGPEPVKKEIIRETKPREAEKEGKPRKTRPEIKGKKKKMSGRERLLRLLARKRRK